MDSRLQEIARAAPGEAAWKPLAEALSERTPDAERFAAYRAIREAGVLPADAAFFLFGHAIQWIPSDEEEDLDRHTVKTLRRHGLDEMADLYVQDRIGYDRRYERGRQYFYGPPDEEYAARLRERGIIE